MKEVEHIHETEFRFEGLLMAHHFLRVLLALLLFNTSACSLFEVRNERAREEPKVETSSSMSSVPQVQVTPLKPIVLDPSLQEIAASLGMNARMDGKSGKRVIEREDDKIELSPGEFWALVNSRRVELKHSLRWQSGVLRGPEALIGELRSALSLYPPRQPVAIEKLASAPRPVVKDLPEPEVHAPGLPNGWNVKSSRQWTSIVIHHSATPMGGAMSFHKAHAKKWQWGLGYHFVVGNGTETKAGQIEVGQRWTLQNKGIHGAHAGVKNYNEHGIGICLVGNFQEGGPSAVQLKALADLCKALMARYNIPASKVLGHKHARPGHTDCPGKNFPWDRFRKML